MGAKGGRNCFIAGCKEPVTTTIKWDGHQQPVCGKHMNHKKNKNK